LGIQQCHRRGFREEKKLDAKPRILVFPEVVEPHDFDASKLRDGKPTIVFLEKTYLVSVTAKQCGHFRI